MLRIAQVTLDVQDIDLMAAFWSAALGYRVEQGDDGNAKLLPPPDALLGTQHVWLQQKCAGTSEGSYDTNNLTASVVPLGNYAGNALTVTFTPASSPLTAHTTIKFYDATCRIALTSASGSTGFVRCSANPAARLCSTSRAVP